MKLTSSSFSEGQKIPSDFAFCSPHPTRHICLGHNLNPQLAWSDVPSGTKSWVVICHDPDVPSQGNDVNQEGRSVPATLARVNFHHWVLVDFPADRQSIEAGEFSQKVIPRGKSGPAAAHGARQGLNDYSVWFADDQDMCGDYYGYDGPCPPWNDEIRHHYVFTVFALDLSVLPIEDKFTAQKVYEAMQGHILGQAQLTGTYSLNPALLEA